MADEARAMLDALMGADRNEKLPEGVAVKKRLRVDQHKSSSRRKQSSCYDLNTDPLYNAWGIDVYELFTNTKSDLGSNPNVVSKDAREEYLQLPPHEQERLGFESILFRRLQDLVKMCDRTVSRNKQKLAQERVKEEQKRSKYDPVSFIDPAILETHVRNQVQLERVERDIQSLVERLEEAKKKEKELQEQVAADQEKKKSATTEKEKAENGDDDDDDDDETKADEQAKDEEGAEQGGDAAEGKAADGTETNKGEEEQEEEANEPAAPSQLDLDLRQATIAKQRLLFDLTRCMQQYAPLQERLSHELSNLQQVRSDITSDKTVCEVSGNFMSARDADERIAAHYAGKQYVGWKLVRDKLKEMQEKYGRYGPPPPPRGGGPPGRGDLDPRGPPPPPHRGGRRFDDRGGGRGGYGRGPSPDRWERGGGFPRDGGGGGGGNRGYGGGGDRRGGSYRGGGRRW